MNAARDHRWSALFGCLLGVALGSIGFGDWATVNAMFTFKDTRLLFSFLGGVVIAAVGLALIRKSRPPLPRPMHKGIVPGALIFGAGWALCGACPSIAMVQLGEGQLGACLTLGGVVLGTLFYKRVLGPRLRIDSGSCEL